MCKIETELRSKTHDAKERDKKKDKVWMRDKITRLIEKGGGGRGKI